MPFKSLKSLTGQIFSKLACCNVQSRLGTIRVQCWIKVETTEKLNVIRSASESNQHEPQIVLDRGALPRSAPSTSASRVAVVSRDVNGTLRNFTGPSPSEKSLPWIIFANKSPDFMFTHQSPCVNAHISYCLNGFVILGGSGRGLQGTVEFCEFPLTALVVSVHAGLPSFVTLLAWTFYNSRTTSNGGL